MQQPLKNQLYLLIFVNKFTYYVII